jgi:putative sigma-54 modulation protein
MKIQVIGKNITVTDAIRKSVEEKLKKLEKYFKGDDETISTRVVVRSYKVGTKIEVTIYTPNYDFRAEVQHQDLYAGIDLVIDKLLGQMRKLKARYDRKKDKVNLGKAVVIEAIEEEAIAEEEMEVVRTKSISLKPMSLDEAITRMNALGHSFFIYLDSEDEKVCVVYARDNGGYGVIEVENEIK